ncbi:hypothetical protein KY348_03730 [Candidatus Woesearchaeota archaeon]|nr:hypothetical protein [Candidatus Woesearchaeota archaeon]
MRTLILILLIMIMISGLVVAQEIQETPPNASPTYASPRYFKGTVNISVINPSPTILRICTSNEKYNMEPGDKETIRLYIRNAMEDKTVKRIDLDIEADKGFDFSFAPEYLEDLEPDEYSYFDITVSVSNNTDFGNYRVDFLIGTDEYMIGALSDEIMIRIRPYSNEIHFLFGAIIIIIAIALIVRFVWILRVNRRAQQKHKKIKHRKTKHRKKAISQYYYKSNKKNTSNKKNFKINKKNHKSTKKK